MSDDETLADELESSIESAIAGDVAGASAVKKAFRDTPSVDGDDND